MDVFRAHYGDVGVAAHRRVLADAHTVAFTASSEREKRCARGEAVHVERLRILELSLALEPDETRRESIGGECVGGKFERQGERKATVAALEARTSSVGRGELDELESPGLEAGEEALRVVLGLFARVFAAELVEIDEGGECGCQQQQDSGVARVQTNARRLT